MSLFDFLFPEVATASHLRSIAQQNTIQSTQARIHQQRLAERSRAKSSNNEERIAELENEVGKAALVIESLIEILEESGIATRQKIAERTYAIDGRDGVIDGKLTPEPRAQFVAKHTTEDIRSKLNFPSSE